VGQVAFTTQLPVPPLWYPAEQAYCGMHVPVPPLCVVAGQAVWPVPDTATVPLPPGAAENVMVPERAPAAAGLKPMRTVHVPFGASAFPVQSPATPDRTENSLLSEVTAIVPLLRGPVLVTRKLCGGLE
jgi:hypothetical protein